MTRTVRIDGFRPGKVPLKVIKQKYGTQVRHEVIDQVVNSTIQEAFTRESIRPAGHPEIEPRASQPGEPLEYIATFEIYPELAGDVQYKFSVTRPVVKIGDEDIDNMLENLREQRATWDKVDRVAGEGDQVNISFEGTIDGEAFTGNKAENYPLVLGSGGMIPGFEDQLQGASAGDDKELDVMFPVDYPSAEFAGKSAKFVVQVHSVSEMVLPELNEEFAQAFGIAEGGMGGLRNEITQNMQRELRGLVSSRLKNQVFNCLLESNPVEVPGNLVESEVKELQSQQNNVGRSAGSLVADAEKRVKLGVIISEVARQNQIQIDPDRVRGMVETLASSYEKPEEVVQWYYGNQEMLAGVQSSAIEDQVVEWIVEHSGVEVKDEKMSFSEIVEEAKKSQG